MNDETTTTTNLVAAIRERDQRIVAMTEALLEAADREDKHDAAVTAAVEAERARIRARVGALTRHACEPCDDDPEGWMVPYTDVLAAISGGES